MAKKIVPQEPCIFCDEFPCACGKQAECAECGETMTLPHEAVLDPELDEHVCLKCGAAPQLISYNDPSQPDVHEGEDR